MTTTKHNPDAMDAQVITPSDVPEHLRRRFHIELNHRDDRETVVIQ
jgi:hypothetical protein